MQKISIVCRDHSYKHYTESPCKQTGNNIRNIRKYSFFADLAYHLKKSGLQLLDLEIYEKYCKNIIPCDIPAISLGTEHMWICENE